MDFDVRTVWTRAASPARRVSAGTERDRKLEAARQQRKNRRVRARVRDETDYFQMDEHAENYTMEWHSTVSDMVDPFRRMVSFCSPTACSKYSRASSSVKARAGRPLMVRISSPVCIPAAEAGVPAGSHAVLIGVSDYEHPAEFPPIRAASRR